jgi:hypothetical protein
MTKYNRIIDLILSKADLSIDTRLELGVPPRKLPTLSQEFIDKMELIHEETEQAFESQFDEDVDHDEDVPIDSNTDKRYRWCHGVCLGYYNDHHVYAEDYDYYYKVFQWEVDGEIYSPAGYDVIEKEIEKWKRRKLETEIQTERKYMHFRHSTGERVNLWDIYERKMRISKNRARAHEENRKNKEWCKDTHYNGKWGPCVCDAVFDENNPCDCDWPGECFCNKTGGCLCDYWDSDDSSYETEPDSTYDDYDDWEPRPWQDQREHFCY